MVIAVEPSVLVEVICETPEICANCVSSGWATAEAMVSGLAPGSLRGNLNGREIDLRQRRDRQLRIGDDADEQDADHQQRGCDRDAE